MEISLQLSDPFLLMASADRGESKQGSSSILASRVCLWNIQFCAWPRAQHLFANLFLSLSLVITFFLRANNLKSCYAWPVIFQSVYWSACQPVCLCSSELVKQSDLYQFLSNGFCITAPSNYSNWIYIFLDHIPSSIHTVRLVPKKKQQIKEKAQSSNRCSNHKICWPKFCDD